MAATSVVPSTRGVKFTNCWPGGTPDPIVRTGIDTLAIGKATAGPCLTACDLFDAPCRRRARADRHRPGWPR